MDIVPIISIILEALIAVLAFITAVRGRFYMMGFTLTFGIYVYYDLARYYSWEVSESLLSSVFLIATLAALTSMIGIIKNSSKSK